MTKRTPAQFAACRAYLVEIEELFGEALQQGYRDGVEAALGIVEDTRKGATHLPRDLMRQRIRQLLDPPLVARPDHEPPGVGAFLCEQCGGNRYPGTVCPVCSRAAQR